MHGAILAFFGKIKAIGVGSASTQCFGFARFFAGSEKPTEAIETGSMFQFLFQKLADLIIEFVYKILYVICKFALRLVDFLEILVNKLAGINQNNESYTVSGEINSNPIYRFLFNEHVLNTFLILLGLSIVLLIVFSIIAIVKSEYDVYAENKEGTKLTILKRSIKSMFLFVAAPIVIIIMVIFSGAVLNSFNQAMKSGNSTDFSLGNRVFIASTYEANRYRVYAQSGDRISILFDFEEPSESPLYATMTAEQISDSYASWTNADSIFSQYAYSEFDSMKSTLKTSNGNVKNNTAYSKEYENFVSTSEQYYVMADFIDYAISYCLDFYIKALDDENVDWEGVKSKIGTAMFYQITNNNSFSVSYSDENNINDGNGYQITYVSKGAGASTPLEDALSTITQILALDVFSDNTFRVLEIIDGYSNYVDWKTEKAQDFSDASGETIRPVFEIYKYTFNTNIEEIELRDPIKVVQKNGEYYRVDSVTDNEILKEGVFSYTCDTSDTSTKIDRVSVDHIATLDDGTFAYDYNGEIVTIPADILTPLYSRVTWPEKIYADLNVIFRDVNIDNKINDGTWASAKISDGSAIVGDPSTSATLPTAFISPYGLIMAELFLGNVEVADDDTTLGKLKFSPVYSKTTTDALVKSIGALIDSSDSNYYATLSGQINYFVEIFNSIMGDVIDTLAYDEGIDIENEGTNSVTIATYVQYLSSLLLTNEFAQYFADLALSIVNGNAFMNDITLNLGCFKEYEAEYVNGSIKERYESYLNRVLMKLSDYNTVDDSSNVTDYNDEYLALYRYTHNGESPNGETTFNFVFTPSEHVLSGTTYESISYSYNNDVLWADDFTYTDYKQNIGKKGEIESRVEELKNKLVNGIYLTSAAKSADIEEFHQKMDILGSLEKYLIKESIRTFSSSVGTESMSVCVNGKYYSIAHNLPSTYIMEIAFGNQLVGENGIYGSYYQNATDLLYVDSNYAGFAKISSDKTSVLSSFAELQNFLQKFGEYSFKLQKSNFSSIGIDGYDGIVASNFYSKMSSYIKNTICETYPSVAGEVGLVNVSNLDFVNTDGEYTENGLIVRDRIATAMGDGIDSKSVLSNYVSLASFRVSAISGSTATIIANVTYNNSISVRDDDGKDKEIYLDNPVEITLEKELFNVSDAVLVENTINYWGFDFEASTIGRTYNVQKVSNQSSIVVIDDEIYYVEAETRDHFYVNGDKIYIENNEVNIANNTISVTNNTIEFLGKTYIKVRGETTSYIKFLNGKYYPIVDGKVVIGNDRVGKTLIDYRRDALDSILKLSINTGETEDAFSIRFLTMLTLLCSDYNANEDSIILDNYTKSVVKSLSSIENRPDSELVSLEYDFEDAAIQDEAKGTVFVICTYDNQTEKFLPFLVSTSKQKNKFSSNYVINPNGTGTVYYPIVAKGAIDDNGYPTAIRVVDGNVEFYREDIKSKNASSFNVDSYYATLDEIDYDGNPVSYVVNGISKLITGKTLPQTMAESVPRIAIEAGLKLAIGTEESVKMSSANGKYSLDYSTNSISMFYNIRDLNIIVLLFGTMILLIALMMATWGLIQRIFDIVVLMLIAPPIIATLPIDGDNSPKFTTWRDKMVASTLSVFGLIIGLNVFFILAPAITMEDTFFTENGKKMIMSLGIMNGKNIDFVNNIMQILFLLVALTLIRSAPKLFSKLINPDEEQDIFSKGESVQSQVKATIDQAKDFVSGQYALDKASNLAGTMKSFIPGRAIAKKAMAGTKKLKNKTTASMARRAAIANGVPKDEAKQAAKALQNQMASLDNKKNAYENKQEKEREQREKNRSNW